MSGKAVKIKRFEYSPVRKELKKQASIAKDTLTKKYISKTESKKRIESGLLYSNNFTFFKHRNNKNLLSFHLIQYKV